MALICMAVYDTEENGRSRYTKETLFGTGRGGLLGLIDSVDFIKHRMIIVDNDSCEETKILLRKFVEDTRWGDYDRVTVIPLPKNVGTAKAVNRALAFRKPEEYAIKMDNDVLIESPGWVDRMEEAMRRMPLIGILGLKRRDLLESPYAINTDQRSRFMEVPHETGERWFVVEECKHVMGTCTMLSPKLLETVGYFYQCDGLYGFDDSLMCVRSTKAGFFNCFLHGIDIEHVDPGGTAYTDWKAKYAGEMLSKYAAEEAAIKSGLKTVYHGLLSD
jgi:GT2 family glycosyltransferase